ncbi:hypothetical protein [Absidia glauca]|uniref:Uncharacterized protein n=1 Tax=Absidia glauca TaxID=4829 RepID=A0A163J4E6_ABSGL|nr:hypothetical protein [Absidia glauca]
MDPLPHSFYLSQRSSSRMSDDEPHNNSNSRMSDTEEALPPPSSLSSSSTITAMMIPGRSGSVQLGRNRHHPYHRHHHRRHSSSSCSSSSLSSTPLSPTSSFNKMSVDSDDGGRSVSSSVGWDSKPQHRNGSVPPITTTASANVASPGRTYQMGIPYSPTSNTTASSSPSKQPSKQPTSAASRPSPKEKTESATTPERRTVRRSSLLLKSKALSRVMHQAEEEIHLADLEMRREGGTTQKHLGKASPSTSTARMDDHHPSSLPPPPPSPYSIPISSHSPWPHPHAFFPALNGDPINNYQYSSSTSSSLSSSPTAYQCSRLNPEIEMTHFQFENLPSPMQSSFKSIKRKASEDRLWDGGLKRRAVSPSVSLSGSPTLTASPPPTASLSTSSILSSPSSSYLYPTGGNAAARPSSSNSAGASFNLHEASGGLSRMSLS